MDNRGPARVLSVSRLCCKGCALKVKKQLKKINGVTSIKFEMLEGLVKVFGVEDASILIEAIKKGLHEKKNLKVELIESNSEF